MPQTVFVRFFRDGCVILGFLCPETCLLPALPGDDRVIGSCESFLLANGRNPLINRLLVNPLQAIQLGTVDKLSPSYP